MPAHHRPHVVLVHSHDTGRFVQPYGHAIATPHVQRLAEEGVLFRQAYCAGPTCSPSRASLLTGMYPHNNGMIGLHHRGFRLHDPSQHIAAVFGEHGYQTARVGTEHVTDKCDPSPWGHVIESPVNVGVHHARHAMAWLREHHAAGPCLLSVGFFETHREFPQPGPHDDPRYTLPPAGFPDTPETRSDMAAFKTMARAMDEGVGVVLAGLEELGIADRTLVIYTTDHGIAFPRYKCNMEDSGIGVALVMRGPAGSDYTGGKVVDSMVSHLDLFPTLCDICSISRPQWLQGHSLTPLVDGRLDAALPAALHEAIFSEVTYHAAYEPQRCVRTSRWKYIRRFNDRERRVLPNCDDGLTRRYWLDQGWREQPYEQELLFDLVFDPNEANNLAASPHHADLLSEMRSRLDRWMRDTHDPLLHGSVAAPKGAIVNSEDQFSFREPTTVVG